MKNLHQSSGRSILLPILIILIILILPFCTKAQLHVDFGAGVQYFDKKIITRSDGYGTHFLPAIKLAIGAQFSNNVVIETALQATVTTVKNLGAYFAFKGGYNVNGLVPMIGYYYHYKDADNTEGNKGYVGYSLKFQRSVNANALLYVEGLYVNKTPQLTAGIHFEF